MIALWGIYLRELGRLLSGSATTVALPLALAALTWQQFLGPNATGQVQLDTGLQTSAGLLAVLAVWCASPALAWERMQGTANLWATCPVRPMAVVLGKFLAEMTYLILAATVLLAPLLWLDLEAGTVVWSRWGAGASGLLLVMAALTAVTLLASSLVTHFSTAFLAGVSVMAGWLWGGPVLEQVAVAFGRLLPQPLGIQVENLGHWLAGWNGQSWLSSLYVGWVDLQQIALLLAVTAWMLVATHRMIVSERWRG